MAAFEQYRSAAAVTRSSGIVSRWVNELAMLLPQGRKQQPWQALLQSTPEGLAVYLRNRKGEPRAAGVLRTDGTADFENTRDQRRLRRVAKQPESVLLRLAEDEVIQHTITIPAGARDVAAPIVRNQIELISPWPIDKAVYDWELASGTRDTQLQMHVAVAGKSVVDAALADTLRHGLTPGCMDFGSPDGSGRDINFLLRKSDRPIRGKRLVQTLLFVFAATAVTISSIGLQQAFQQREALTWTIERNALAEDRARNTRQILGEAARLEARYKAASDEKYRRQPMVAILEALSRLLPDRTWLTKVEVNNGSLSIAGRSSDAAALIALLEGSPHFRNVRFAAPVTPVGGSEEFVIEADASENLEFIELLKAPERKRIASPTMPSRSSEQ